MSEVKKEARQNAQQSWYTGYTKPEEVSQDTQEALGYVNSYDNHTKADNNKKKSYNVARAKKNITEGDKSLKAAIGNNGVIDTDKDRANYREAEQRINSAKKNIDTLSSITPELNLPGDIIAAANNDVDHASESTAGIAKKMGKQGYIPLARPKDPKEEEFKPSDNLIQSLKGIFTLMGGW